MKRKILSIQTFLVVLIVFLAGFLRFYDIQNNPPGLYIDEVSIGYNAYTILTTGKDEHGVIFPLWFQAFGEYKLPVYIYMTSAAMAVFGKNEFAVRFPSALFGTLTVLVFYFFVSELLRKEKPQIASSLPLLASFLLAISPWHIQFSRGGFEANIALFFYLLGVFCGLLFIRQKKSRYLFGSFFLIVLTMYTYQPYRIIAPLTIGAFAVYVFRIMRSSRKQLYWSLLFVGVLFLPIIQFTLSAQGAERFTQTSAFSEYKTLYPIDMVLGYPLVFLKNYLSFFSAMFLFGYGDGIGRHQDPNMGLLYYWQLPFLIAGVYALVRMKPTKLKYIILFILLVTPIPAALARPSPHTLRSLLMVVPYTLLVAYGTMTVLIHLKKNFRLILIGCLLVIGSYEFLSYLHYYYVHYPKVNPLDWGANYKQLVADTEGYKKNHIIVADTNLPYVSEYFHFYDDSLPVHYVGVTWIKPKDWGNKKVLYIRPYYGKLSDPKIIHTVYLPTINHDVFAQFWKM